MNNKEYLCLITTIIFLTIDSSLSYSKVSRHGSSSEVVQLQPKNDTNKFEQVQNSTTEAAKDRGEHGRAYQSGPVYYPAYSGSVAGYQNPSSGQVIYPKYPGSMAELDNGKLNF